MKYFSLLLVLAALFTTGNASAQDASRLNGKSFTYIMKNADGTGEEIQDQIRFNNNTMISDRLYNAAKPSFGKVMEKNAGESSVFQVTMVGANGDTYKYNCNVNGKFMDGTIQKIDASGKMTEMVMRGMTSEEFQRIRKEKEDYQKANGGH